MMRWDLAGNMLGAQPSPQSPRGSIGGMPLTPMAATQSPINDITQLYPTKGMALDEVSGPSVDPWAAAASRNQPDEIRDPIATNTVAPTPAREKLVNAVMGATQTPAPQQPQAQSSPAPSTPSFAPPQGPRPQSAGVPNMMRPMRPFGGGGFRQPRPRTLMRPGGGRFGG